jgi:hypothetical protein
MTTTLLASAAAVWSILITTSYHRGVSAHGYLKTPRSRNLVAFEDLNWETYLGGTGGANAVNAANAPLACTDQSIATKFLMEVMGLLIMPSLRTGEWVQIKSNDHGRPGDSIL